MADQTIIKTSFASGEISPSLFARVDLDKYHTGAAVMRNFFVDYRGGASTRPGTAFVGQAKYPPPYVTRLIPFQFSTLQDYALELGNYYMRVILDGAYVLNSAVAASITAAGQLVISSSYDPGYFAGEQVYLSGFTTLPKLNNKFYILQNGGDDYHWYLVGIDGQVVPTSWYGGGASGGQVASIYELSTPWAHYDLPLLKYTQSTDTMTFAHPNYPPYDVTRTAPNAWTATAISFVEKIAYPQINYIYASNTTNGTTYYYYAVTAVSATGEESLMSPVVGVVSVDISVTAGYIQLQWNAPPGALYFRIYRAPIAINGNINYAGQIFGYIGEATGLQFFDNNIVPDFTRPPPTGNNPFINNNYPGTVSYFQQRKVFGGSNQLPESLFFTQPGNYSNMDLHFPSNDDDAIAQTLASQQVNAVKHFVSMPSGLLVLTSSGAWQVSGGSPGSAISPSAIVATPQAYNGCSDVPPIVVNYDILFVQEKGSIVRDLAYNYFVNIYTGSDITILSNHLFYGHQIVDWAYAEEPFKLIWAVRDDGTLLSLTYLKDQQVQGWARHDTNGLFTSVTSISEGEENAVYFAVQRYVNGAWRTYIERMASRLMPDGAEDAWCLDCARQYPLVEPAATAQLSASSGQAVIGSVSLIANGSGYTAPAVEIVDDTGNGATATATVVNGQITAITVTNGGQGYTAPQLVVNDPTGSGCLGTAIVTNPVTLTASAAVFSAGNVGAVYRGGGAMGTVIGYNSTTSLTINLLRPATAVLLNDPLDTPVPQVAGNWSLTQPVSTVYGMDHLIGKQVTALADGNAISGLTVAADGSVTLPQPASLVTIGLPFQAQLQTLNLEGAGGPTMQGKRKKVSALTMRVTDTRGLKAGPDFDELVEFKSFGADQPLTEPLALQTGDQRINIPNSWDDEGRLCIQQDYPLPATVLGVIPEFTMGDT